MKHVVWQNEINSPTHACFSFDFNSFATKEFLPETRPLLSTAGAIAILVGLSCRLFVIGRGLLWLIVLLWLFLLGIRRFAALWVRRRFGSGLVVLLGGILFVADYKFLFNLGHVFSWAFGSYQKIINMSCNVVIAMMLSDTPSAQNLGHGLVERRGRPFGDREVLRSWCFWGRALRPCYCSQVKKSSPGNDTH